MSRTNIAILIGLPFAALLAWTMGGAVGMGVIGGYLLGGSVFGFGHAWQHRVVAAHPERSMNTLVVLMMAKLLVLLFCWLLLRFVEGASSYVDTKGFLLAYVTAVMLVSFVGSFEAMTILKNQKAQTP